MELYKISDDIDFKFYRLPKQFFEDAIYKKGLTTEAKLIYAILVDRLALSKKNNWVNEKGEIFLYYTKKDIAEMLDISERASYRAFNSLVDMGLIKQVKQGLNRPNKIYIGMLKSDYTRTCQNGSTGHDRMAGQDLSNWQCNDTEFSDTDLIDTDINNDKGIVSTETNSPQSVYSFNQYCNEYHVDDDVTDSVKYYLEIYKQYQNRIHPRLKVSQWQDVTDIWFGIYDENLDRHFEVDSEEMVLMVDKHFETEYKNCDYNILHFIRVKVYRMYEEAY